jgi:hypothetical protein
MFGQLLPNKNKNATVPHNALQYIRDAPNRASKQGASGTTQHGTPHGGRRGYRQYQTFKLGNVLTWLMVCLDPRAKICPPCEKLKID